MNKNDLVLKIFLSLKDEDLINFDDNDNCGDVTKEALKAIDNVLKDYVVVQGEILED